MRERPILFNTEMVMALLEGRKTCTRRVLKQPFEVHPNGYITKPRGTERLCPYIPPLRMKKKNIITRLMIIISFVHGTRPSTCRKKLLGFG